MDIIEELEGTNFKLTNVDKVVAIMLQNGLEQDSPIQQEVDCHIENTFNSLLASSQLCKKKFNFECKSCIISKITKQAFKLKSRPTSKVFERLHLDLVGPINPQARNKAKFILTVVNNFSGYITGFPLLTKDDVAEVLINLLEGEKKRLGYLPTMICSDGGGEFIGTSFVLIVRVTKITMARNSEDLLSVSKPNTVRERKAPMGTCPCNHPQNAKRQRPEIRRKGRRRKTNWLQCLTSILSVATQIWSNCQLKTQANIPNKVTPAHTPRNVKEVRDTAQLEPPAVEDSNHPSDIEEPEEEEKINNLLTPQVPEPSGRVLRDQSQLKPPVKFGFHNYYEPNSFESAIRSADHKRWREAISKEVESF
ncbi:hypothetical protein VP01_1805g1 [Puccinia sorghi]|uniref:Integrase catalytic domain-containing protein n=1 Tax=Puccinia sorghi TaxID=27349 RepID=A0A0L6VG35_9BASI|nr:hypothetical protein VP01_1805g1 [Puccinia sorghi]